MHNAVLCQAYHIAIGCMLVAMGAGVVCSRPVLAQELTFNRTVEWMLSEEYPISVLQEMDHVHAKFIGQTRYPMRTKYVFSWPGYAVGDSLLITLEDWDSGKRTIIIDAVGGAKKAHDQIVRSIQSKAFYSGNMDPAGSRGRILEYLFEGKIKYRVVPVFMDGRMVHRIFVEDW